MQTFNVFINVLNVQLFFFLTMATIMIITIIINKTATILPTIMTVFLDEDGEAGVEGEVGVLGVGGVPGVVGEGVTGIEVGL
jgi:hypothetical protein